MTELKWPMTSVRNMDFCFLLFYFLFLSRFWTSYFFNLLRFLCCMRLWHILFFFYFLLFIRFNVHFYQLQSFLPVISLFRHNNFRFESDCLSIFQFLDLSIIFQIFFLIYVITSEVLLLKYLTLVIMLFKDWSVPF